MRLSDAIELLARRLQMKRGRVATIANRLQHTGALPLADAKRTPPELSHDEIAALLIAVLAECGIGGAAERAATYSGMTAEGYRLAETVLSILRGDARAGDFIFREGGVCATVNDQYVVFGSPAEDGPARFATGATLSAIAAEIGGARPGDADAVAAITKVRNY